MGWYYKSLPSNTWNLHINLKDTLLLSYFNKDFLVSSFQYFFPIRIFEHWILCWVSIHVSIVCMLDWVPFENNIDFYFKNTQVTKLYLHTHNINILKMYCCHKIIKISSISIPWEVLIISCSICTGWYVLFRFKKSLKRVKINVIWSKWHPTWILSWYGSRFDKVIFSIVWWGGN